jgi:hypothetical protein
LRWFITTFAVIATALPPLSAPAHAQRARQVELSPADQAIAAGKFGYAEDLLFYESSLNTRDFTARAALGAFMAARGRFLVGATLLEEAMQFGADSVSIQTRLFEVYRWEGRFAQAASQRLARVSPEIRAAFERVTQAEASGAPSATVPMQPNEMLGLGRIAIQVGGERIESDIQPLLTGVMLPSTMQLFSTLESVTARGDTTFAVASQISIGGVHVGPVPVMLVPGLRAGRIGLDVLALLRPTLDQRAGTLTVRSTDPVPEVAASQRRLLFLNFPGVSYLARDGEGAVALHTPAGRAGLRGMRWTLDVASGAILIER